MSGQHPPSPTIESQQPRISSRLRNALVADLVESEQDVSEVDRLLTQRMDEGDWTDHLARQLGFRSTHGVANVHDTLMVLIPELDRLLRTWPLPVDGKAVATLAREATKSLTPLEAYATLLVGPGAWHSSLRLACSFEGLGGHFREAIERGLRSTLSDLLRRWNRWDIPRMRERWQEARRRQEGRDDEERATDRARSAERRRARLQETKEDRERFRAAASYQPPGRTY